MPKSKSRDEARPDKARESGAYFPHDEKPVPAYAHPALNDILQGSGDDFYRADGIPPAERL